MMAEAFVLVNVSAGKVVDVLGAINNLDEVSEALVVSGPYDLIARIKANDFNSIATLVLDKIQAIDGVIATITCNVVQHEE